MKSVCVFCGSSAGKDPAYLEAARLMGMTLAAHGITLIYGGAAVGIMGAVADGVLESDGKAIGVIPDFLSRKEIRHEGLTQLITVESMHERKQKMAQLAEGFVALPGGFGTLDELFEMWTLLQLRQIIKPIGILNVEGYYDGLLKFLQHCVDENFIRRGDANQTVVEYDAAALLDRFMDRF